MRMLWWRWRRRRLPAERLLCFVDCLHFYVERNFIFSLNNLWKGDETVHKLLTEDFPDDVLVVVVPESSGELVIVHVVLVLS